MHGERLITRCFYALRRTLPPIDDDQKLALLHTPFKGTTLFGGELAKLQEANTKRAATFTVFPQPTAPPASYSTRPYVGRGRSFTDRRGYKKSSGRGRGQGRSTPSAMSTKPGRSKEGQATLTVSVPLDSNKRKVESRDNTPQTPRKNKRDFRGGKNQGKKRGCAPPTIDSSWRETEQVCGGVETYNEQSLCLKYRSQGVLSPPLLRQTPWEIRSPRG